MRKSWWYIIYIENGYCRKTKSLCGYSFVELDHVFVKTLREEVLWALLSWVRMIQTKTKLSKQFTIISNWLEDTGGFTWEMVTITEACPNLSITFGHTIKVCLAECVHTRVCVYAMYIFWCIWDYIFVCVGGHINPAVTFGLFLAQKVSLRRAIGYIIAQCLGAICGVGLIKSFQRSLYVASGGGANFVNPDYSKGIGLAAEIIGTFVLVYTVFSATDPKRNARDSHVPVRIE